MKGRVIVLVIMALVAGGAASAEAELPWQFGEHTRYLAMGDSLTAGYGALPQTNGYAYLIYRKGVLETVPRTLFSNAAIPGAKSSDVLVYQVPQAVLFKPDVVTLTVGGNDLLGILSGEDPGTVLAQYGRNLSNILVGLCTSVPGVQVFVGNLYFVPLPIAQDVDAVVGVFNEIVEEVVYQVNGASQMMGWGCGVKVADLYSAMEKPSGLLLIERNQANPLEIHPTNAGHRAMADAFVIAITE